MSEIARRSEIILYQTEDGKTKLEVRQYLCARRCIFKEKRGDAE